MTSSSAPELSAEEAKRLTLIAFIHQQAEATAALQYPRSVTAILLLHDTVELFLGLAASHLEADAPKAANFTDYWSLIAQAPKAAGRQLTAKGRMRALNDARVAFKHHGTMPSEDTVRRAVADVRAFLATTSESILGVDYTDIDLVDLVPQEEVRLLLREARRCQREGDIMRSADAVAVAFARLTRAAATSRGVRALTGGRPVSRFERLRELNPRTGTGRETQEAAALYQTQKAVNALMQAVEPVHDGVRIIGMGISMADYGQFLARMPIAEQRSGGADVLKHPAGYEATSTDVDYGVNFVVEAALRIADEPPLSDRTSVNEAWAGLRIRRYQPDQLAAGEPLPMAIPRTARERADLRSRPGVNAARGVTMVLRSYAVGSTQASCPPPNETGTESAICAAYGPFAIGQCIRSTPGSSAVVELQARHSEFDREPASDCSRGYSEASSSGPNRAPNISMPSMVAKFGP